MQVYNSDLLFVDARERRGLGVGAEMMFAKFYKIPIITLSPKNSHYRKENAKVLDKKLDFWTHPFISALSDEIVENIHEAANEIKNILLEDFKVKNSDDIFKYMKHYYETQFAKDMPMQDLFENEKMRSFL